MSVQITCLSLTDELQLISEADFTELEQSTVYSITVKAVSGGHARADVFFSAWLEDPPAGTTLLDPAVNLTVKPDCQQTLLLSTGTTSGTGVLKVASGAITTPVSFSVKESS